MFCPRCGADVPAERVCRNCGTPLEVGDSPAPAERALGLDALKDAESAPVGAAAPPKPGVAGKVLAATGATAGGVGGAGSESPSTRTAGAPPVAFMRKKAPKTAFVLAVVGLVLAFPVITAPIGLVCSIVALSKNARYDAAGMHNERKRTTTAVGVLGAVASAAALVVGLLFLVPGAPLGAGGVSGGDAASSSRESSAAASASSAAASEKASESSSAASSEGSKAAREGGSSDAEAYATSADTPLPDAEPSREALEANDVSGPEEGEAAQLDERYFDGKGNLTVFAICELGGEELQDVLGAGGYVWVDSASVWATDGGSIVEVEGADGSLPEKDAAKLDRGAAGSPCVYVVTASGYSAPGDALSGLTQDVNVTDKLVDQGNGDIVFGAIRASDGARYLCVVTTIDEERQTLLLFNEEAIAQGLFKTMSGVDAGNTIEEIWEVLSIE